MQSKSQDWKTGTAFLNGIFPRCDEIMLNIKWLEVEISRYTMCLSGQFEFEDADVISLPLYRKFTVDLDD